MNKYILKSNTIIPMPVFMEAETYEEAIKKVYGEVVFKEVPYDDIWDVEVFKIHEMSLKYSERKCYIIRSG